MYVYSMDGCVNDMIGLLPAVSLSEDSLLVFSNVSLVLLLLGRGKDEAMSKFIPPLKQSCVLQKLFQRCDASVGIFAKQSTPLF